MMVLHKVFGIVGGALNGAKGLVTGQRRTSVASRTLVTSAGVKALTRSPSRDPEKWKDAIGGPTGEPLTGTLLKTVFLYGDLCEITYNNYVHNEAERAAVEKQLAARGKAEQRAASVLGGVWVGGFRYGPSELMALPAGNKQKVPQSADEGQLPADIPPNELNVARDSPARAYTLGVPFEGTLEDDPTFFLFSTSGVTEEHSLFGMDLQTTNWIGYVGIGPKGDDGRDIAVAFRGTQAWSEWLSDARGLFEMNRWSDDAALLVGGGGRNFPVEQILARELGDDTPVTKTEPPAVDRPVLNLGDVRIGEGFEQMYRGFEKTPGNTLSLQGQVQTAVRKLLARYADEVTSISTTGHSLGGALASLCAFDLVQSGINHQSDHPSGPLVPVTAFTFEAPRVGNEAFAKAFDPDKWPMGPRCLRIVNAPDVVPKVPYSSAGDTSVGLPKGFIGQELEKFLRLVGSQADQEVDGLEAYHHGGTEFLLDDTARVDEVEASHSPSLGPLKAWLKALQKLEHLPQTIGMYHDLQLVLRQMDDASDPPTRGVQGPLGVPDNVRDPKDVWKPAASS